jgi:hypothetical protein
VITNAQNIHTQAVLNAHNQFAVGYFSGRGLDGELELIASQAHNVWSFWTQMPSEFQSPRIINNTSDIPHRVAGYNRNDLDWAHGLQFNPDGFDGLENHPPCYLRTEPPVYFPQG